MNLLHFFVISYSVLSLKSAYVVLPQNFTKFLKNSPEEVKQYFHDNQLVAVDYLNDTPVPPSNCLNASIDNPSLLIYCLVIALIWLATVATGLFFYFRAIFQRLSSKSPDIELQDLSKNGLETNRKNFMGK